MKILVIAALASLSLVSTASAFEATGKMKDLPLEFTNSLMDALAQSGLDTKQKIRAIASDMGECVVDIRIDGEELLTYNKINGGGMTCPNGLKVKMMVQRSASGLNLKAGQCSETHDYYTFGSIFGWKNGSGVCNFGKFGALSKDVRLRLTAQVLLPDELASK